MKNIFALLAILLLLTACAPQSLHQQIAKQSGVRLLTVQAEGQVKVNPDQLQLRLGVVTEAETAGPALEKNNQRMNGVMQMLRDIGISDNEMTTGQFRINPQWSRPPRPTPASWQRTIIGYRVNNELLISTTRVELAGKLLGLAEQAGANQIGGLQFGLADPDAYQRRAIEIATAKAQAKAETLARAAGVALAGVQTISLGGGTSLPQPRAMLAEMKTASVEPVPVAAGKVEVSATVTIAYRLTEAANTAPPPTPLSR